ncbi:MULTISPECIES: RES family NAD+ phosphorylase [Pseudomonas]|uniref:RES domain-containing protein n=1 Tax=Pseudomonas entomophila TaxID=312306 RepID=A0A3S8ULP1_9PSED|nr:MULTISPECIES: RES family NAD+ phosphorylase [Pseudomonas]AZL69187.1 RES domain-containing protein [Pseudomonas oryziphila]UVL87406.1 RES family NAD+ phosphorylase [Pseudomonas sichuanensis]
MADQCKPDKPPTTLHVSRFILPAGTLLHRVHQGRFGATEHNATGGGNARFSPISTAAGAIVPTLYAGSTFHCAVMETTFHDVSYSAGLKTFQQKRLNGLKHSVICTARDLTLVDLSTKALRRLGIERQHLIDTPASEYGYTRSWAKALHQFMLEAQGLRWISRQDDQAEAYVLFGDRLGEGALVEHDVGRDLQHDPDTFGQLLALADMIGVLILPEEEP